VRTDFICHGCSYNVQEDDTGHKGYCNHCHAKGVGLPQIKKVEKWQARDGSYHDSREAAEEHQLKAELETALKVGEGYVQRQATHLLSHFDIVRKGDAPKQKPPAPPPLRNPNAGHDHSGIFVWASVMVLCISFGVLIGWKMHG